MRDFKKKVSLAQQLMFLKNSPVCSGEGSLKNGQLIWQFNVSPTPMSRTYTVQIKFDDRPQSSPDVYVLSPDLQSLAGDRKLPHVYHNPLRLCLYLPGKGEWNRYKRIDQTIVPWTSLWLFYFEEWLLTDDWKGGGKHPEADENNQSRSLRRLLR